jgi:hypothetical protein
MNRSRRLSRRQFLGGAAVTIALPPFQSLLGDRAYADAMASRKRVLTLFAPNGVYYPEWPKPDGGLEDAPLLEPLAAVKGKISVLTNLANLAGVPSDGTGDHAAGTGAAFNAVKVARADGAGIRAGISVDQAAARHLKQFTRIASLQFGVLPGKQASVCEFGYACLYENCISWLDETQALPPIYNPKAAFEQLFAGLDPASSTANQQLRLARRKSVLDYVREETSTLKGQLGRSDGLKLDQMLSGIGDLDRKLRALGGGGPRCGGASSADPGDDLDARGKLFNDVIVAAFQCDVTRVISHILAPPFPDISYTFLGAASGHHAASHWFDANQENDYRKICRWHMQQLGDLLGKLDAVPDGAGTLLDGTFVMQTSDCGYSHTHDHKNLPVVIAGGAGRFKTGRHVVYPPTTPIANLFISVLNAVGVPATRFGEDGTGPLANL